MDYHYIKVTLAVLILVSVVYEDTVIAQRNIATSCYGSDMFLNCIGTDSSSWGKISIFNGTFGTGTCPEYGPPFCCKVNTTECSTLISSSEPEYYAAILSQCNGQYQCSFPVNRTTKPVGCWVDSNYTDLMKVGYTCTGYSPSTAARDTTIPTSAIQGTQVGTDRMLTSSIFTTDVNNITDTYQNTENVSVFFTTGITDSSPSTIFVSATTSNTDIVTTERLCGETIPFYRSWIFIGLCSLILLLLIIILILSVCLCRKGKSPKKPEELDDEGGFRRPQSVRHYDHPLFAANPQGAFSAARVIRAPDTNTDLTQQPEEGAQDEEADETVDGTDADSVTSDSFDDTPSGSVTDSESQKPHTSDAGGRSTNAEDVVPIRVYPQNTSGSLIRARAASMRRQNSENDSTNTSIAGYGEHGEERVPDDLTVTEAAPSIGSTPTSRATSMFPFEPPPYSQAVSKRQPIIYKEEPQYARVGQGTSLTVGTSIHQYRRAMQNGVTPPRNRPPPVLTPPPPPTSPPPDSPAVSAKGPGNAWSGPLGSASASQIESQYSLPTNMAVSNRPTTGTGQPRPPAGAVSVFPVPRPRTSVTGRSHYSQTSPSDLQHQSQGMEMAPIEHQRRQAMERSQENNGTAFMVASSPMYQRTVADRPSLRVDTSQQSPRQHDRPYSARNGDIYSTVNKANKPQSTTDQPPRYFRVCGANDNSYSNEGFYV